MDSQITEIAADIYRIHTPVQLPGGFTFSFNQYLLVDEEPLLFHTGPRKLFAPVSAALARVMPLARLRHVALSHVEADECGAMNEFLAAAPQAAPLCGRIAAMTSMEDLAERAPRALADGELLCLGRHTVQWFDTPHLPHGWECGLLMDTTTRTFFCGDLFTQPGAGDQPLTDADILGPSEAFRQAMDYFAHAPHTPATLERLATQAPRTLACMHGSAWRGDGGALLRDLAGCLAAGRP
ncbi:MBL fold metallo-hydrolase [Azohydromonas lata]|uniref:MBL fold metallo-hydrolase n=1 Tax=Azohydromonas lata TaxID=45677 RepID=UPI0008364493|nr:MBL fold metallo-hydrolase [Azohydromonas lata]